MTFTPATSACTSPIALSGVRLLPSMIRNTSRAGSPCAVQVDGREHQTLGERVRGQRGQATGRHAAHVGDVDEGAGEEPHAVVGEHRTEHEDVVGVDPAAVRVVHREHVAGSHRGERDVLDERGKRAPQAGGVHEAGRGRQRHQLRVGVEDRRARVGAFLDERAVRGAHDDDARLLGGDEQRAADHLRGDDVVDARRRGRHRAATGSRVAYGARVVSGGTVVVVAPWRRDDADVEDVDRLRRGAGLVGAAEGVDLLRHLQPGRVHVAEDRVLVGRAAPSSARRAALAHHEEELRTRDVPSEPARHGDVADLVAGRRRFEREGCSRRRPVPSGLCEPPWSTKSVTIRWNVVPL